LTDFRQSIHFVFVTVRCSNSYIPLHVKVVHSYERARKEG
jgi:hypothetical protein